MAIATAHAEVQGYPKEHYDWTGAQHVRKLRCAWADRLTLIGELDDSDNWTYPYDNTGAILDDVKVEPERNSRSSDAGSGKIAYQNAIVTCRYTTLGPKLVDTDLVSEHLRVSTTGGRWSNESLYWDAGQATSLKDEGDIGPQRLEGGLVYTLRYHRAVGVPASVGSYPGYLNSNTVTTKLLGVSFSPYFLLYHGAIVDRKLSYAGVTLFDVTHVLEYTYNGGMGWNAVWRKSIGAYAPIYNADGDQVYPYPWAAFSL